MKNNAIKKILSLLLVICMMAFFSGCIPGEEDPTEPSTIETTDPTENIPAPTDGTDATSPTEETHAPTEPTEAETEPPVTLPSPRNGIDKLLLGNGIVVNTECRKIDSYLFLCIAALKDHGIL